MNILKDFKGAVDAITKIEGEDWKKEQLARKNVDPKQDGWILGAVARLSEVRDGVPASKILGDFPIYVIYGAGGWNRYSVTMDGDVKFSRLHSGKTATRQAKVLGFKVF